MSATDYLPRCKYKKNLANDVQCEQKIFSIFIYPCIRAIPYQGILNLQKYGKNPNSSTLRPSFFV